MYFYPTKNMTLVGTLIGGGGGGSGAIAGDGDKNASYTVVSGAGADGQTSAIYIDNVAVVTSAGGAGGVGVSRKVGGNPSFADSGNKGGDGQQVSVVKTVSKGQELLISPGYGGGGGGGCSATAGGTTGSQTFTASRVMPHSRPEMHSSTCSIALRQQIRCLSPIIFAASGSNSSVIRSSSLSSVQQRAVTIAQESETMPQGIVVDGFPVSPHER